MKHIVFFLILMIWSFVSQSQVTDIDGNTYSTVKIGEQVWMKENLRVTKAPDGTPVSRYCYDDNVSNCEKYGGLYIWAVAMNGSEEHGAQGICPDGWRMPKMEDWEILSKNFSKGKAGAELKIGGLSGYDALFGGTRSPAGGYTGIEMFASFWCSSCNKADKKFAGYRFLNAKYEKFSRSRNDKRYALSVRCIKK